MPGDEATLIRRAQRGEPDAVEELFRRHWRGCWRAAYAVTGRRELANDVAQEAFVRAISSLARFDGSRPFAPWLTRIAVNLAVDELRGERRLDHAEPADAFAAAPAAQSDDRVVRTVARLGAQKRLIVVLHYWLDYPTPEIARLLDLPLGTVASRLSRALDELRLALEAEHV
jgi:RNA polymerase sigma-70 factor (ECF subfamily)